MQRNEKTNAVQMFKDYADWTVTTSVHKTLIHAKTASILGIAGEIYEFNEKLYNAGNNETHTDALVKELGDVFYYIGHTFYRFNWVNLIDLMESKNETLEVEGMQYAMKLLEHYKKIVRDADYDAEVYVKKDDVILILNTLLTLCYNQCTIIGIEFKEVLKINQNKLISRFERGVIGGHGDER